jgi:hypothetical protein
MADTLIAGVKHWAAPPDTIITDHKDTEFCVMRLNSSGNFPLEKFYGGTSVKSHTASIRTSDNGFIVAVLLLPPMGT